METFRGETVKYATGYEIKDLFIKQHFLIGFVLSLTIIGIGIGMAIILRGIYMRRNPFKSLILTENQIFETLNGQVIWQTDIKNIYGVRGRTTTMGFFEVHFRINNGPDRYVKGNFYENEIQLLVSFLKMKVKLS